MLISYVYLNGINAIHDILYNTNTSNRNIIIKKLLKLYCLTPSTDEEADDLLDLRLNAAELINKFVVSLNLVIEHKICNFSI